MPWLAGPTWLTAVSNISQCWLSITVWYLHAAKLGQINSFILFGNSKREPARLPESTKVPPLEFVTFYPGTDTHTRTHTHTHRHTETHRRTYWTTLFHLPVSEAFSHYKVCPVLTNNLVSRDKKRTFHHDLWLRTSGLHQQRSLAASWASASNAATHRHTAGLALTAYITTTQHTAG